MNETSGTVQQLGGAAALGDTLSLLWVHGLIAILVALVAVALAWFAAGKESKPNAVNLYVYCSAFSIFGVATAYFLSLGLSAASNSGNTLLASFVAPFISLLTGGVAYVASKSRDQIAGNDLVLGVICFLLGCILSYETLRSQITEGEGLLPIGQEAGQTVEPRSLPQPDDGNAAATEAGDRRTLPPPRTDDLPPADRPRQLPPPE